jgi:hypothetical protein
MFTRLIKTCYKVNVGAIVGSKSSFGYLDIMIDGKSYRLHRLAWLYMHGKWPKGYIDHINGIKDDNRICNLRDVTNSINQQNRNKARTDSKIGLLGVIKRSRDRYESRIKVNGESIHLGISNTPEEAHQIYLKAKRQLHEGCTI